MSGTRWFWPWSAAWLGASAWLFLWPARGLGRFPVPLDDSYIYFDFACTAARGEPFAWLPGGGFSSGATSLPYPLLLAPGCALGLDDDRLGAVAIGLALLCLLDLCRSLRALAGGAAWLAAPLVVAVPLLAWSWWSGMETALFAAVVGRSLRASHAALASEPTARRRAQLRAGAWLALLPLVRPESVALSLALGLALVHGARSLATLSSLARVLAPLGATLATQALSNHMLTGEWVAAGAVRKLLTSDPYAEPASIAFEATRNLIVLVHQTFGRALGSPWPLLALLLAACAARRTRRLALGLCAGAGGALVLASLNATARFQNYRYAAPSLVMLLVAALLGAGAIAAHRRWRAGAWLLGGALVLAPTGELTGQREHFTAASRNIAEQHGEVARRLDALGARRILLHDAGAIPFLSRRPAIDAFGLGGFRGLPFARASLHGAPAVVELFERLPARDRPDLLAAYPEWLAPIARGFGRRIDAVRISGNVICGADEMAIYRTDWSELGPDEAHGTHELDVADLVDERARDYQRPARRGWVIEAVAALPDGRRRWDAGRIIAAGEHESFVVPEDIAPGPTVLLSRSDEPAALRVTIERDGRAIREADSVSLPSAAGDWLELRTDVGELRGGDRLVIEPLSGGWRSFHHWLSADR